MASAILNFSEDRLITGVNIVDDMLFFTDNHNEPKKINIETFRNAEHSTGTTAVYGRSFQERDITVIRPHPLPGIATSLSALDPLTTVVPTDTEKASVITLPATVKGQTKAVLFGRAYSSTLSMTDRGFYYLKADRAIDATENDLITQGTKVQTFIEGGNNFSAEIDELTVDTRYYFVAYAFNGVGEEVLSDQILTFKTDAAVVNKTAPSVTTNEPVKQSAGKYRVSGSITDTGGSQITGQGFYYISRDILNNVVPANLYNTAGRKSAIGLLDPATGEYYYQLTPNEQILYVQFWAKNETGITYGAVKGGLATTGTSEWLKPEVRYINSQNIFGPNNIKITGQVPKTFNNPLKERGVILSKNASDFISLQNWVGNPNVHKVIDSTLNESNWKEEFVIETSGISGFNLSSGDVVYAMVYGDNGVYAYSDIIPIGFTESITAIAPNVYTTDASQGYVSSTLVIRTEINVVNNGINSEDNSGITGSGYFQSCGVYVYKATELDEFANLSISERQDRMLEEANRNNAVKFIYEQTDQVLQIKSNVTEGGITSRNYKSTGAAPLDYDSDYYVMAFCDNGVVEGYGAVRKVHLKNKQETPPDIITIGAQTNADKSVTLRAMLRPGIEWAEEDQADIYDVGFAYARRSEDAFFDMNLTGVSHVSLLTPGVGTVKTGTIADINKIINSDSTGSPYWEITIPHAQFATASTRSAGEHAFQATVRMASGALLQGAKYEGEEYHIVDNGVMTFNTFYEVAFVETAPILDVSIGRITQTSAKFFGTVRNAGLENNVTGETLPNSSKKFFYMKTADVVGSTELSKIAYLIANGTEETSDPGNLEIMGPELIGDYQYESNTISGLDPDTSYSVIAHLNNGSTTAVSPYANYGYGVGVSEYRTFQTSKPTVISDWITLGTNGNRPEPSRAWLQYKLHGDENSDLSHTSLGVYVHVIKASDFTGTTAQELMSDPDATWQSMQAQYPGRPSVKGNATIAGLEPVTEYLAAAKVNFNAHGVKYSNIYSFTTTGFKAAEPASITADHLNFSYDNQGRATHLHKYLEGIEGATEVYVSPADAKIGHSFGSGQWYSGLIEYNYTSIAGKHLVSFDVAPNLGYNAPARNWTMSLFNENDRTKLIHLTISQEASNTGGGGSGGSGGGVGSDTDDFTEDGFEGLDGFGNNNNTGGGNGGGSGPDKILFDEDGNADWDAGYTCTGLICGPRR